MKEVFWCVSMERWRHYSIREDQFDATHTDELVNQVDNLPDLHALFCNLTLYRCILYFCIIGRIFLLMFNCM